MGTLRSCSIILILLTSCKSAQQIAAEQEQKERNTLRHIENKYAADTKPSPPLIVPGGMVVLETPAPCPDFDSGSVKSKDGKLSASVKCPDKKLDLDSIVRNSDLYKAMLAGRRLAEMKGDSTAKALAVSNADRDRFKKHRNTAYWIIGGIAAAIGVGVFFKIKLGAAGLAKRIV